MIATRPPAPRQCGRCRLSFPGDPAFNADEAPKWWLCEPCRLAFFGLHRRLNLVDGGSDATTGLVTETAARIAPRS